MKPTTGITALIAAGIFTGSVATDASNLRENPIERVEIVAEEQVEVKQIGNVVETTLPWKDQSGIKVKYDMGEPTITERLKDRRDQQVFTETVNNFDGGFKVDIILDVKPDTNRFCYQIEGAENYDFFYQPPLTVEDIAEGISQPPEIDGSYAVYHKNLKNHQVGNENYATGKVMHIPRPQVWELNNELATKEWAQLSYSEQDGLCVTVRQGFLDGAQYPVRVDPTFGYTTIGASTLTNASVSAIRARIGTPASSGTISAISIAGFVDGSIEARGALYDASYNLVATQSGAFNITNTVTSAWTTVSFTGPSVTASLNYYVSVGIDGSSVNTHNLARDTGGNSGDSFTKSDVNGYVYPTWNNPLSTRTDSTSIYSIYATYTESTGSSSSTPIIPIQGDVQVSGDVIMSR